MAISSGPNVSNNLSTICVFLTSGTFTPAFSGTVEVLVVGGGGGGGMDMGGGGGGGGVIKSTVAVTAGTPVTVTVGAGGFGAPAGGGGFRTDGAGPQPNDHQFSIPATNGGNSVFGLLTAIGGGRGGSSYRGYTPGISGASGGSGGGSGGYNDNAGTFSGGAGTAGQGFRGGNSTQAYYAGGGGGAGGQGVDSTSQPNGGPGVYSDILGTGYYWGGGGGSAAYSTGQGGNGGIGGGGGGANGTTTGGAGLNNGSPGGGGAGGIWAQTPGGNAGPNTGGGGGGSAHYNRTNKGGEGGSGIVVVRFLNSQGTATATNGVFTNTKNDLIMHYDTASSKSWRGAPTTNLVPWDVAGQGFGTDTPANLTQTANSTEVMYQGKLSRKMVINASGFWNCYTYSYNTGVSSTVFAASCKIKTADGSHPNTFLSGGYIYGSATNAVLGISSFTADSDGWYRVTWLYSGASMTLNSLTGLYGTAPSAKTFYMTDYQVEALSYSTLFAGPSGSRSNTQAIVDTTGNSIITANSLTYASNIAFSFNGSNYASTNSIIGVTDFTVEIWFKSESVANYRNPIDCNWLRYPGSYSNVGPRLEQNSSGNLVWTFGDILGNYEGRTVVSSGLTQSVYHCTCLTKIGNIFTSFYNGSVVQSAAASYTWPGDFNNINIGRGFSESGERWFIGEVPVVKIYSRGLSAAEVQRNFAAIRGRYGI
jgi:hypothetical protein